MRTSRRTIFAFVFAALPLASAFGFDGTPVNGPVAKQGGPTPAPTVASVPSGSAPLGNKPVPPTAVPASAGAVNTPSSSRIALEYAAEGGHPVAQWKLGRMYADGDGVVQNDLRAFEYFSKIANQHAEDNPWAPQAGIIANAFVALGRYYLSGIPNTKVKADPERAREMLNYAASYFGNADAQYDLARLYLRDAGSSPENFRNGTRWLGLAAQKGQYQAQALLGQMLFNGDQMPPQRARGLMWLTLARENAGADEAWIKESYNRAIASASESDRAMALQMLELWVKGRPN
ncbi:MAG: tetratricopeptide repeat protein [Bradyrhizobium sp.]|nr:tetratricopeptide repeat protein [Bradyrhizobium sp.]